MKRGRFEKMVEKRTRKDDWGIAVVSADEVLALLRKEHAAVRRMVKSFYVPRSYNTTVHNGLIDDMLAALNKRAKGGTK